MLILKVVAGLLTVYAVYEIAPHARVSRWGGLAVLRAARARSFLHSAWLPVLVGSGLLLSIVIQMWLSGHPDSLGAAFVLLWVCGAVAATLVWWAQGQPVVAAGCALSGVRFRPVVPVLGAVAGLVCAGIGALQVTGAVW